MPLRRIIQALGLSLALAAIATPAFGQEFSLVSVPLAVNIDGRPMRSGLYLKFEMKSYNIPFDQFAAGSLDKEQAMFVTAVQAIRKDRRGQVRQRLDLSGSNEGSRNDNHNFGKRQPPKLDESGQKQFRFRPLEANRSAPDGDGHHVRVGFHEKKWNTTQRALCWTRQTQPIAPECGEQFHSGGSPGAEFFRGSSSRSAYRPSPDTSICVIVSDSSPRLGPHRAPHFFPIRWYGHGLPARRSEGQASEFPAGFFPQRSPCTPERQR